VTAALGDVAFKERQDWMVVLHCQERLWAAAYARSGAPQTPLSLDLLEDQAA
jgi:hypothetical protein